MAKNKLHVTTIKSAGPGLLGDGGGLYIKKTGRERREVALPVLVCGRPR